MGAMSKMRNSTPVILWVLIFSFGVLWVLQDTQVFDALAGGPTDLGTVNGSTISLEEFNNRVSYYVDQHNQQSDSPMEAGMRSEFEEQAWDDLVTERLMAQKMEELGIVVTDREVVNMITGDNPDPFIRQQFGDESGQIDRVALRAAIEAPENQEIWMMIEQQLRQNRQQQKLSSFITSGMRVNDREIKDRYIRDNSYADIRFVRFPYSEIEDDQVSVTDEEIRSYYNENRSQFHRNESYRFQYVIFSKTPTAEDTTRTVRDVENLRQRFEDADNHADFLQQVQSVVSFRDSFVDAEEIRDEYRPVLELEVDQVSEVYMIDGDPHMFKKVEERNGEVKFAILSYQVTADPIATIDQRAEEAEEFTYFAREDGFETEAEVQGYEVRRASATRGTPVIPELGQARELISQLERMSRGGISEPVELRDMFVVARLDQVISEGPRPLEEVRTQIENRLRENKRKELAVQHLQEQTNGGERTLEEIAEAIGGEIQTASNVRYGANNISGAGREPGIIGSVFGLPENQRSGVLAGIAAAFIVEINDRTIADPSEMTSQERQQLRRNLEQQKYFTYSSVWLEELREGARIRDNRAFMLGGR